MADSLDGKPGDASSSQKTVDVSDEVMENTGRSDRTITNK
jgi:hypothetical protein